MLDKALDLFKNTKILARLSAVSPLGNSLEARRVLHVLQAQIRTPQLAKCTTRSLLLAALNVVKLGLNPDPQLGLVYIVPFGTEATVIIGYKGYIELARRSGKVVMVKAELIYSGDIMEYEERADRTHFVHSPAWLHGTERGDLLGGYTILQYTDGTRQVQPVPRSAIDKARKHSRASSRGPWVDHEEAMQLKSVVRKNVPFWPLSAELSMAADLDMRADVGMPQGSDADFADVMDVEAETTLLGEGTHKFGGQSEEVGGKEDEQ